MSAAAHREDRDRIVVTGMGAVTVIGETPAEFLSSLLQGRSGITRWKKPWDERCHSKIGGDMSGFALDAHLAKVACPDALAQRARRLLRATPLSGRLVSAAAIQAWRDAGLDRTRPGPERLAHVLGGHNLNMHYIVENVNTFAREPEDIDALFGLMGMDTDVLSVVSELLSIKGPSFTVGGACASGHLGLMCACDLLRAGRAETVLVTGGALDMDVLTMHSWATFDAISHRSFNDEPARASRPFDVRREGFVPSEGAAAVIIESLASARAREARVHAEVLGISSTSAACRKTKPDAEAQTRCMAGALRDAGVAPEEIQFVSAHATSTKLGDAAEVQAIKSVLGDHARRVPVNATKSMIGHCLTSAGTIGLVACILQMTAGAVHPTINLDERDPELDLDFVPREARQHRIDIAASNAFGFGGLNCTVVLGKV